MKSYSSREVIKILKADGWYLDETEGSHHQFKHPVKKEKGQGDGEASGQGHTSKDAEKDRTAIGA